LPINKLSLLYSEMENIYNQVSIEIGLSCLNCSDNCCTSYFHHHTYIEWAYLWEGIKLCPQERQIEFRSRAREYVTQSQYLLKQGLTPDIICPLNNNGLCQLYKHRLMICRLFGVPNFLIRPDGKKLSFPGCVKCQQIYSKMEKIPILDRTNLFKKLASLEIEFMGPKIKNMHRLKMTIAEMLLRKPPEDEY
jgi:hypothetical protein